MRKICRALNNNTYISHLNLTTYLSVFFSTFSFFHLRCIHTILLIKIIYGISISNFFLFSFAVLHCNIHSSITYKMKWKHSCKLLEAFIHNSTSLKTDRSIMIFAGCCLHFLSILFPSNRQASIVDRMVNNNAATRIDFSSRFFSIGLVFSLVN